MQKNILTFYKEFSIYTNPGLYLPLLKNNVPNEVQIIGNLVRRNFIHRTTLATGNKGTNKDKKFGDMNKVPWYRQPEDDILITATAMLAELYRRDDKGFTTNRKEEDKLVLTCRYVAIIMASILKSKGIPCRVRAGHAPYFAMGSLGNVSTDHWINQYWDSKKNKWITFDVDGSWSLKDTFDPYDIPMDRFDFPADAWLAIRSKKINQDYFYNASGTRGSVVVFWSLFYDFHCLMNDEIPYIYGPHNNWGNPKVFDTLSEKDFKKIDELAILMQEPDKNFDTLRRIWGTNKEFRMLNGGLL